MHQNPKVLFLVVEVSFLFSLRALNGQQNLRNEAQVLSRVLDVDVDYTAPELLPFVDVVEGSLNQVSLSNASQAQNLNEPVVFVNTCHKLEHFLGPSLHVLLYVDFRKNLDICLCCFVLEISFLEDEWAAKVLVRLFCPKRFDLLQLLI